MFEFSVGFSFLIGTLGLAFASSLAAWILRQPTGRKEIKKLSDIIHQGAMTFLKGEYKPLAVFVVVMAGILAWTIAPEAAIAFVGGSFCSALAGNIGMRVATKSNARAAVAAKEDIGKGLKIGFFSGTVMGMCVVGLALIGLSAISYWLWATPEMLAKVIVGFGFGASSIALFARVGGGIYTKSADMGADLVGKVEEKIPEDDPRNPGVIADNVGDNVGDVAGMGADLFESYAGSIISAITIGYLGIGMGDFSSADAMLYPLMLAAFGILCAIAGVILVRPGSGSDIGTLHNALNKGVFGSAILMAVAAYFLTDHLLGTMGPFYAIVAGLAAGIAIGQASEYFTENRFRPTRAIAESSTTGPATNIVSGFSTGMLSTLIPVIAVCAATGLAYQFAGLYGIPIAAVGMLSTLGITLATDTYGPVNDNAAGIAEMGNMGSEVRSRAEKLDAVGNTTAAIGKGFAIGSAALTALALFAAYTQKTGVELSIINPMVVVGLFLGGLLTFVFSALTMSAVGRGASSMVKEIRRQFKEIPGILKGERDPDYERCIEISTSMGLKNMILPGGLAVATPIAVGLWNPQVLGGLLAGAIITGLLLAITLANAGGAWDNAKKYIEEGKLGGKGSEAHAAAVTGDTVGDPFKDTSGPALNILIKVMAMISLLFVPLFIGV